MKKPSLKKKILRITSLVMLLVLSATLLGGCRTPESPVPDINNEANEPIENGIIRPVTFSTKGGAVIIGIIDKDEEGWFITPAQPLNIEITSSPSVRATNVKRINLRQDDIYAYDMSVYNKKEVTVEGTVSIDIEETIKAYMSVSRVLVGYASEVSRAMNEKDSAVESNRYDISKPLPEKMTIKLEAEKYVYNPYRLSDETIEHMGNGFVDFYASFVDAYLGYAKEVACPKEEYAKALSTVIFYEFPLFAADAKYEFVNDYDSELSTVTINYTKTKEEHDKLISDFYMVANQYLASVNPNDTEAVRARALYNAFVSSVNRNTEENPYLKSEAYYAYSEKTGIPVTFSNAFCQLLTQIGVKGTIASGIDKGNSPYVWVSVNIEGYEYFCDIGFDISSEDKSNPVSFGLTTSDLMQRGVGDAPFTVGRYNPKTVDNMNIAEKSL